MSPAPLGLSPEKRLRMRVRTNWQALRGDVAERRGGSVRMLRGHSATTPAPNDA